MFEKASNGDGGDRVLFASNLNVHPQFWSSQEGVLFRQWGEDDKRKSNFWLLRPGRAAVPTRVTELEVDAQHGRISPDGQWLAYESYASGGAVIVRPLQSASTQWQVSSAGSDPRWRADGRELFYLSADLSMMAVEVEPGPTFRAKPPRALFQTSAIAPSGAIGGQVYDVAADGQRFLIKTPASSSAITVVVNWPALLGDERER